MIPVEIYSLLKCCIKPDHVVKDPRVIYCGGNCCSVCLDELLIDDVSFKCSYCNDTHSSDIIESAPTNPAAAHLINLYQKELFCDLETKYNKSYETYKELSSKEQLNNRIELVANDVDIRIESLKSQLDEIKKEYMVDLRDIKLFFENSFKEFEPLLSDDIYVSQKQYLALNEELKKKNQEIASIQFEDSDFKIKKSIIGRVLYPKYIDYSNLRGRHVMLYEVKKPGQCVVVNEKIFVTFHNDDNYVHEFALDGTFISKFNMEGMLVAPWGLSISDTNELIVCDGDLSEVLWINKDMKTPKRFRNEIFSSVECIQHDNSTQDLFCTSLDDDCIYMLNKNGVCRKKTLENPCSLAISIKKLFVTSKTFFERNGDVISCVRGGNCIFILEKTTLDVVKTVRIGHWLAPTGLQIDENELIYTIAFSLSNQKNIETQDLFSVNHNSEILFKIDLKSNNLARNFVLLEKEIVVLEEDEISILKFI